MHDEGHQAGTLRHPCGTVCKHNFISLSDRNKTMTNAETLAVMDWVHNNPELEKNMLSIFQQLNSEQSVVAFELEWNKWANNQDMKDRLAISQSVGSHWRIDWNEITQMIGIETNG